MVLEPYAPAASLLLLALMMVLAFARVRAAMKRHGVRHVAGDRRAVPDETPAPWWVSHLDDYANRPVSQPQECVDETEPCADEYVMVAPVELWFGEQRVAVHSGSETHGRFQRFAAVLLEDLAATRVR